MKLLLLLTTLLALVAVSSCSDITNAAFGKDIHRLPAAFGDFNSDELTDMFVLSQDDKSVHIMFASVEEPLFQLKPEFSCTFPSIITSVVPGDFDGDVFMDILVTTYDKVINRTNGYILWGKGDQGINCTNPDKPVLQMIGQPLAIDYNHDMIIDLFGTNTNNSRTFWIFDKTRGEPTAIPMTKPDGTSALPAIRIPHSNAFLDLNGDFLPDLVITTDQGIEYWYGKDDGFEYNQTIPLPVDPGFTGGIGQSLHLDVELEGKMDLVLPICMDKPDCKNSLIKVYSNGKWNDLQVDFKDSSKNAVWGFAIDGPQYTNSITLRGGDFNMDGYPDLLATLKSVNTGNYQSFLFENVACDECGAVNRTFKIKWTDLTPFYNESVMAVFYDFYQDGILDVILVLKDSVDPVNHYKTAAFKNSLDYDANFVKVMVLTSLTNDNYPSFSPGSIGKKKRTYGTNLPGPSIAYKTTTQDGNPRNAVAAQIPQSAHHSLNLPFTIFGLGRTPNFIETLTVGLAKQYKDWPQIIPNSQMVVIPNPITDPSRWKALLFVTPSKLILLSAAALTVTCGLITLIIIALYWKERREDKIEKLQEAHRFHFDAM